MMNFFLSLKTAVWFLLVLIVMFFVGSYLMPAHRAVFGTMNDLLLFDWMQQVAIQRPWETWWFFASLALLLLLTINTIACSLQAVKGRWTQSDFSLRIAPQIIHIGFLFILLAHLLGASMGYRLSGMVPQGAFVRLPEGRTLHLQDLQVMPDRTGFPTGWRAGVEIYENGEKVAAGTLGPNSPLFHRGVGIYLKSFDFEQGPVAFLMVNKDPGALWALIGAVLFTAGSTLLLALKWKKA
jgi:cytochrome c biogenesis protein ResB